MIKGNCTVAALHALPAPPRYVPHGALLTMLLADMARRGWHGAPPVIALSKDKLTCALATTLSLVPRQPIKLVGNWRPQLLVVSHNGGHRRNLYYLGAAHIEGGGVILHEDRHGAPHSTHYKAERELTCALDALHVVMLRGVAVLDQLRQTPVGPRRAQEILCEAAQRKLLSWSRVGAAVNQFLTYRESDGASLLRAFAVASAKSPQYRLPQRVWNMRSLLTWRPRPDSSYKSGGRNEACDPA